MLGVLVGWFWFSKTEFLCSLGCSRTLYVDKTSLQKHLPASTSRALESRCEPLLTSLNYFCNTQKQGSMRINQNCELFC